MIYEKISLFDDRPHITLTSYVSEISPELRNYKKAAVLVLPGGGYHMTSDREAEPVAKAYFASGFNAFVLRYSVKAEAAGYAPLTDAAAAIKFIRDNAEKYNIDKDKIAVCGFSAGGHLAASIGTLWKLGILAEKLGCSSDYIKPNGMILGYAVISSEIKIHEGILGLLTGKENPSKEELDKFSLEKHVAEDTCPAFIWHTADDKGVPAENALYMSEALSAKKIPFELHIFPSGEHGISLATAEVAPKDEMIMPYVGRWLDFSVKWLNEIFKN
ncbi:MAG: alpha/beta hydrolase [Oscillospiraceae bacterium]|nr:alpha/beta hydrolase [Oscillospiraceae bacterium]